MLECIVYMTFLKFLSIQRSFHQWLSVRFKPNPRGFDIFTEWPHAPVSVKTQTLRLKFLCKSTTFKGSYFNRIVKLWNSVCTILPPNSFSILSSFKRHLKETYRDLCVTRFDVDMPCTWSLVRDCPCHSS